jgi:Phasin protein
MTTREEKPARPRTRGRKASEPRKAADPRKAKGAAKAPTLSNQVVAEAEPISAAMATVQADVTEPSPNPASLDPVNLNPVEAESAAVEIEDVAAEAAVFEATLPEAMLPVEATLSVEAQIPAEVLSGEVLPPEVHNPAPPSTGLSGVALAYADYTRKSWANRRLLVDRLMTARTFEEVIEIQSEFAKQAFANLTAQSQRICLLYGEWAQLFFRPLERLTTKSTRAGR